jgi:hypothetical protein
MLTRTRATVWTVLVCGTVLSPIVQGFRETSRDDFPLSWFPMFARARPAVETPVYAVAIGGGERAPIGWRYWGHGGFNQGASQLIVAAGAGKRVLVPLCQRIATAVAKAPPRGIAAPSEVRILRGDYALATYFGAGDPTPIRERVLVSCPVRAE